MDDILNTAPKSAEVFECADVTVIKAEEAYTKTILEAEKRVSETRKAGLEVFHRSASPCGLLFDDEEPIDTLEYLDGQIPCIRMRCRFSELDMGEDITKLAGLDDDDEQADELEEFYRYTEANHPEFAQDIDISTVEGMYEFWGGGGDHPGSYDNVESLYWGKAAKKKKRDWEKLESQINRHFSDPLLLFEAGVITKEEVDKINPARPDLKILDTLMKDEELPEMELTFFEGRLCINDVPTVIKEDDLRDLYNGYQAFNGEKKAIKLVVATAKRLLTQLFRKEEK